jgi:hypothetical protein
MACRVVPPAASRPIPRVGCGRRGRMFEAQGQKLGEVHESQLLAAKSSVLNESHDLDYTRSDLKKNFRKHKTAFRPAKVADRDAYPKTQCEGTPQAFVEAPATCARERG